MKSSFLASIITNTWQIYRRHWKVLLTASLVPFLFTVLGEFTAAGSHGFFGSLLSLLVALTGFISYYYQIAYVIRTREGHVPQWKTLLRNIEYRHLWRVILANIWMMIVVVWPMFVLIAVAGVVGFFIGQDSFTGTTVSLIAMGIATIIGIVISFIRSLSYVLIPYLSFTTVRKVRTLHTVSRQYMYGNRIKLLKLVIVQILLGIVAALSVVFLPVLQSLVYIAMVLFAEHVIKGAQKQDDSSRVEDQEGVVEKDSMVVEEDNV